MGVFIGGKPAARMGDMCAHGGSITLGCPTVLIGESGGGGGVGGAMGGVSMMREIQKTLSGNEALLVDQAATLIEAAAKGTPFCQKCS
jgi:hypothetical protein